MSCFKAEKDWVRGLRFDVGAASDEGLPHRYGPVNERYAFGPAIRNPIFWSFYEIR